MSADSTDKPDDVPPFPEGSDEWHAMRDAAARALAESAIGSGLLARQSSPIEPEAVAVLKVCPLCGTEYETVARFCPSDGTSLRPKGSDSLVGRVLADRYHILKLIGEGGMGRVYLGEHVKMNRQCAIKVMSPALVNDAESAARFAREASNAARIIHPNVAAVFDYGESEGVIYLVMEYVEGEPLSRLLEREAPLALDRALNLTRQIAEGLGAAHELGIIHRDLKPDNILIMRTRTGREIAKVVDFGIAKAIKEVAGEGLTRTGQVIGTPEFMSPEQLLGDPLDVRTDLYALGCILHLTLVAAPPFEATTREQMIKRRLSEDAPSVHAIDPGLPDSVARIVARLLARAPTDRYGSAAELYDALSGSHARASSLPVLVHATDMRPTPRSAPTVAFIRATQSTTRVTHVRPAKPVRRVPMFIGGVAVVAIAVALIARSRTAVPDVEKKMSFVRDGIERDSIVRDSIARTAILHQELAHDSMMAAPIPAAGASTAGRPSDSAPAAATRALPIDSAKLLARAARKRTQDSVARQTEGQTNGARAAIIRYAHAMESGNIATLRIAYPAMTPQQQDNWEKNFFARAEKIDAAVRYGATKISGDTVDADFSLLLNIVYKDTKQGGSIRINQHAMLVRQGKSWQIATLR